MISGKTILAGAAASFMLAGAASATSITVDAVQPVTSTNYTTTLSIPQYNGIEPLQSIDFVLNGIVTGSIQAESIDEQPSIIELILGAEIRASTTAIDLLAVVLPVADETFNASAYDGSIDFAGTSGITFNGLSDTETDSRTLTGADMAEFIGNGTVDILIEAFGNSTATGPGNLATIFSTSAGADIEVTYNFGVIPVPAAFPLLLGGMGALYAIRRRQKSAA